MRMPLLPLIIDELDAELRWSCLIADGDPIEPGELSTYRDRQALLDFLKKRTFELQRL